MISKEAIKRGYNRGNYIVGAHTPPAYAATLKDTVKDSTAEAGLQRNPVKVSIWHAEGLGHLVAV